MQSVIKYAQMGSSTLNIAKLPQHSTDRRQSYNKRGQKMRLCIKFCPAIKNI